MPRRRSSCNDALYTDLIYAVWCQPALQVLSYPLVTHFSEQMKQLHRQVLASYATVVQHTSKSDGAELSLHF